MKTRSFFVSESSIQYPIVTLTGRDFHHLQNVLRLKENDEVSIVTFENRYVGFIQEIQKNSALIRLTDLIEPPLKEFKIHLIQCVPKGKKMDFIVEKGTEIGITSYYPIISQRSVPTFSKEKAVEKIERWQRVAQAATKQSGVRKVPVVYPIESFPAILHRIEKNAETLLLVANESEEQKDVCMVLDTAEKSKIKDCWIFIGPEGGITPSEIEELSEIGFVSVTLGHQILRTETAGFFLAGLIRYLVEFQK